MVYLIFYEFLLLHLKELYFYCLLGYANVPYQQDISLSSNLVVFLFIYIKVDWLLIHLGSR